jgi:uncharacterized membrane protein YbhN (UPF0104 family)
MSIAFSHHAVALALVVLDTVIRAVRIRLLVPHTGRLSLGTAIAINAYGDAASAVTPGRIGGDPARFLGFRRAGIDTPRALAGLGVEALIDWVLLGAATLGLGLAFADTAAAGARRLFALATERHARVLVATVLVCIAACAFLVRRYHRRTPRGETSSVAETWSRARQLGVRTVVISALITAASMAARTAILPVLVAGYPGIHAGAVIAGSFALLFGQLALPTPAGAGGVELGFVGGFAGAMSARDVAALLIAWRAYTLILGAALGAALLARGSLARWTARRRYSANSSVKVRSQL